VWSIGSNKTRTLFDQVSADQILMCWMRTKPMERNFREAIIINGTCDSHVTAFLYLRTGTPPPKLQSADALFRRLPRCSAPTTRATDLLGASACGLGPVWGVLCGRLPSNNTRFNPVHYRTHTQGYRFNFVL
jgi:hypothetical protein